MIVMELAKGGELGEYLEKTGKMTEEKAKGAQIFRIFGKLDEIGGWFFWILVVLRQAEELEKRVSGRVAPTRHFAGDRCNCVSPELSEGPLLIFSLMGCLCETSSKKTNEFTWTSVLQPNFILQWKDMFNSWWEDLFEMLEVGFSIQGLEKRRQCLARPWGHGRGIFKQVLSAIQHMHSKNVLHRDLKSDNILPHDVLGLTLGLSDDYEYLSSAHPNLEAVR